MAEGRKIRRGPGPPQQPSFYKRKRPKLHIPSTESDDDDIELPSDTLVAVQYLCAEFPTEKFLHRVPPIILKHQLYTVLDDRTAVDRELAELKASGAVRLVKLGTSRDDYGVLLAADYSSHVRRTAAAMKLDDENRDVVEKFLTDFIDKNRDVSVGKVDLSDPTTGFTDEELKLLWQVGVLTLKDMDNYWVSVPDMGYFTKDFMGGREEVLRVLKRAKYKEELEKRKLRKSKLPIGYHINDLIGAEYVIRVETTSGILLKLSPQYR